MGPLSYEKLLKSRPCCKCGATPVDPAHIDGVKMGGRSIEWWAGNTCPLCRRCHEILDFDLEKKGREWYIKEWKLREVAEGILKTWQESQEAKADDDKEDDEEGSEEESSKEETSAEGDDGAEQD